MKTSGTNRRLRLLLIAIGNKTLIPQPDFQRRLVWTNRDKVAFIKTVLEGYPFPEIYIAAGKVDPNSGEGIELLVDGQQRITTLYQYFKGSTDLKFPKEIKEYKDLSKQEQIAFLEYEVVIRDLGSQPLAEIKEIFQRINSTSYGLNAMEIHNARYGGLFKEFGEKISEKPFFEVNRIFSGTDIKRMNDLRYLLTIIITIMSTYFNRDNELETFLIKYNENFDQADDIETEIDTVLDIITKMDFNQNSRAFKKADFFTLFVELHKRIFREKKEFNIKNTKSSLELFYNKVDSVSDPDNNSSNNVRDYYSATLQANSDRSSRIIRGKIIAELLG